MRSDVPKTPLLADHTGNGTLDAFDLPDGKLLGTVPIGAVHDVAIDREHGKYYVTVSDLSNLTIVNRETLKVEGIVALLGGADGCAYDSKNGLVYVDRDDGEDVWVVDPNAHRILTTIKVPKDPEFLLYAGLGPGLSEYKVETGPPLDRPVAEFRSRDMVDRTC